MRLFYIFLMMNLTYLTLLTSWVAIEYILLYKIILVSNFLRENLILIYKAAVPNLGNSDCLVEDNFSVDWRAEGNGLEMIQV